MHITATSPGRKKPVMSLQELDLMHQSKRRELAALVIQQQARTFRTTKVMCCHYIVSGKAGQKLQQNYQLP